MRIPSSAEIVKRTKCVSNNKNPEWKEEPFVFHIDPEENNVLENEDAKSQARGQPARDKEVRKQASRIEQSSETSQATTQPASGIIDTQLSCSSSDKPKTVLQDACAPQLFAPSKVKAQFPDKDIDFEFVKNCYGTLIKPRLANGVNIDGSILLKSIASTTTVYVRLFADDFDDSEFDKSPFEFDEKKSEKEDDPSAILHDADKTTAGEPLASSEDGDNNGGGEDEEEYEYVDKRETIDLTEDKEFTEMDIITQEIINYCVNVVQNPVEILKYAQRKILNGRPLETADVSIEIEGETNFILVDRENLLELGFEEISTISNFRLPLEVNFIGEAARDFGGPRKEFFRLMLIEIKNNFLKLLMKLPTFMYLFIPSEASALSVEKLANLLTPKLSEEGSNAGKYQKEVYAAFIRYIKEVAAGRRVSGNNTLNLGHVLQFVCGTDEEPTLGFVLSPEINFIECGDAFMPTANTCINVLNLPISSYSKQLPDFDIQLNRCQWRYIPVNSQLHIWSNPWAFDCRPLNLTKVGPPRPSRKGRKIPSEDKYLQNVEEEINDISQWLCFQKQTIVNVGDLNMDRLRPDSAEGKILTDLQEINYLECLITKPTRISVHSQTLLDVLLTNTPELFVKSGTYDPGLSDHCMVYGEMKEKVHKHRTKVTTYRQTRNTDFQQLNHELLEAPWHVGEIFTDVDDKYEYWTALFECTVNAHAPIKRKRVREKDVPYMTPTWKKAIRNKRKHAILFAKNRTPENMELKRKYRNIATRERRKAIMEYWFAKSEELKSKPREFYNAFRPFINSKTKESTLISLKTEEGIIVKDQCEVAEQLVNYFTTAAVSISLYLSVVENEDAKSQRRGQPAREKVVPDVVPAMTSETADDTSMSESEPENSEPEGNPPKRQRTSDNSDAVEDAIANLLLAGESTGEKHDEENSFLKELVNEFNDDTTGPDIDKELAAIANGSMTKALPEDKLKAARDKYPRSKNCESDIVPKVNPEIWTKLTSNTRSKDTKLQKVEKFLCKAVTSLGLVTDTLLKVGDDKSKDDKSKREKNISDIAKTVLDSVRFIGQAQQELHQFRRLEIRPDLNPE
ncbi:hypothetical protein AWC38_SpisGene11235 [Stylophora pistillata]|uniref:HECT domain-containing protein n=1 Tax=Stylophora pistillata TaxID=50429 RepID=A0A2B4S2P6_STYPI|nr:hypothetical protein AWC38_SpisGene11235 [Stylophora pistillata]